MFHLKIDVSLYEKSLAKLLEGTRNRRELMGQLTGDMLDAVEENFKQQGRPAWLGWSPAYAKKREGGMILQKSGRLAASIRGIHDNDRSVVGTNVKYARIHNQGGDIRQKARTTSLYYKQSKSGEVGNRFVPKRQSNFVQNAHVGAYTVSMPARPFLQLIDSDIDKMKETAQRYFRGLVD
ncbi:phage virion morphogenesis protein [Limnobaculum zhutongyuii]|uniref:Phage virion morphogenesis protein n=1 Tax=Limnobaculum zhutongyuii TaxID=2498113 RepID=A0A411WIH8_9GAMM|nr:phage virion morphogenesis protein [Limnobaculum zhutongyuii]QBH95987.1 phage virion morphogenesis protein [Limnobaculum zhutongyuii]TQS89302.1 phage virion morphogenesis protein [Limnobaculum zhutongyuii]